MKTKKFYYYTFNVWYYDNENKYQHAVYTCRTLNDAKKVYNRILANGTWCEPLGYKFQSLSKITKNEFDN